jgi:release factor glutamine methyltransferase
MTVAECARSAVAVLVAAGAAREDARRDVAVLVRHLLGWDVADWLVRQQDAAPEALAALESLVARRATGEPVAYLTGTREFYGRAFIVTPDVLIPRPETELLVERALATIDVVDGARARTRTVIDIGTGSGCIAVTLAAERPSLRIVATDTSDAALAVAAANASRHRVADRVALRAGALTAGTSAADLIVSNPPYVGQAEREALMRDVREFEPASALFAGGDGLDVIRDLVPEAAAVLRPGGALLIEIGAGQADQVGALLSAAGFEAVRVQHDLAGLPRVVEGHRPDSSV